MLHRRIREIHSCISYSFSGLSFSKLHIFIYIYPSSFALFDAAFCIQTAASGILALLKTFVDIFNLFTKQSNSPMQFLFISYKIYKIFFIDMSSLWYKWPSINNNKQCWLSDGKRNNNFYKTTPNARPGMLS